MLPDKEQCNLCICEGYNPISLSTLKGTFRGMMDTLTEEGHHSKPEVVQIQTDSAMYSEIEEHNERKACMLCSSPTGFCSCRCGSLPTQEGCSSDQRMIQNQHDSVVDEPSTKYNPNKGNLVIPSARCHIKKDQTSREIVSEYSTNSAQRIMRKIPMILPIQMILTKKDLMN